MHRRTTNLFALLLIGLLLFGQFNIAFSGCLMDRAEMQLPMVEGDDAPPCDGCGAMNGGGQPVVTSSCLSHCTADLQKPAVPVSWDTAPTAVRVLIIPDAAVVPDRLPDILVPPRIAPPRRVLLHSFLI